MVRSQDYGAHWQLDQTLLDSYHDSKCRYHASLTCSPKSARN
jgi:hypothetical protein